VKRSLGKIIFLFLFFASYAEAEQYQWSVQQQPQELYVGESGIVRFECVFGTSAADYTIEFKPHGNEEYDAKILTQRDKVRDGRRIQTFDVLITPKHEGLISVGLETLIRHTTFASIENATIGRDNVKKYDFNDVKVILPKVNIQALANTASLTGKITLSAAVDQQRVRAHEPVHLTLFVKGSGNLDAFVPYELNISGVKVFAEKPQKTISASDDGFEGEIRQEFALVSEKSFAIPPFSLSVFDTGVRKAKILKTEPIAVEVNEGYALENLLDAPDLGDTAALKRYGLYALLVLFGIVLGDVFRRLWKHRPRRRLKAFWDGAANTKELALLLALSGEKEYENIIAQLEAGTLNLSEAKKKLSHTTQKVKR